MIHKFKGFIFLFVLFSNLIFSQQDTIQKSTILKLDYDTLKLSYGLFKLVPSSFPKVGLALSGGGARGIAQIGVLKAFYENDVPIDFIVGTSIGGIVGGLYALGYFPDEMDSIVSNTDWEYLLSIDNKNNRKDFFIDQKITEDKAILAIRLKGLKPILPTSINDGQKFSNFLNLLTIQSSIKETNDFDKLEIPFRTVCTDLETGETVILRNGSLSQAMRASSSVSFFLSPVEINSRKLVDGGLVANIPVEITRQQGVDFVVAVNTTSDLHSKEELDAPWVVADQVLSIPMKLLNEKQLSKADFVITPNLNGASATNFSKMDTLIIKGYLSALPYISQIKNKQDSLFYERLKAKEFYIKNPIISDSNSIAYEFLSKYLNKDSISSADLLFDLYKINKRLFYDEAYITINYYENYSEINIQTKTLPLIKNISVSGITLINQEEINNITNELENRPFLGELVYQTVKKILSLYKKNGYALAQLDSLSFDENLGELKLLFDEGVISKIEIQGIKKTNRTIIERDFPLKEGDTFQFKKVQQGLTNLRSSNLFENIDLQINRKNGNNDLILQVSEKISSIARIGFRVDNEDKAQLSLDIRDENLLGSATELGLMSYISSRGKSFILEHKANRLFDTYLTYNISAYYKSNDVYTFKDDTTKTGDNFARLRDGEYREIFYGASIAVGSQFRKFGNIIVRGKYEKNKVKNLKENSVDPYDEKILGLKISSTFDTQDKYPYPTSGFLLNVAYETSQQIFQEGIGFTSIAFDYKRYFSFWKNHTISPKLKIGFADRTLPLAYQFSIGGQNSFFGMRDDELRGRQIFLSSLEYRYHLPFKIFFDSYFLLRYDLGSVWNVQEQIRFKDLRHGIGTTLSISTPIGPADFSIGRSFLFLKDPKDNILSYGPIYFYFSIGYYL